MSHEVRVVLYRVTFIFAWYSISLFYISYLVFIGMCCNEQLFDIARGLASTFRASNKITSGDVGAVIKSANGKIYTGVSVSSPCGIGFCAEHSAIAEMLKDKQNIIEKIVASDSSGNLLTPCGRCCQLIIFLNAKNRSSISFLNEKTPISIGELLPYGKGGVCF